MVNIVNRGGVNLTVEGVATAVHHLTNDIGVRVLHVDLDEMCGDFASVIVDDIERDVRRPSVVLKPLWWYRSVLVYGCFRKSRTSSDIVLRRRLERFDVENSNRSSPSRLITSSPPST